MDEVITSAPNWLCSLALVPWALLRLVLLFTAFVGAGCWWPRVTLLRSHFLSSVIFSAVLGMGVLSSLTAVLAYCHVLSVVTVLPLAAASVASGTVFLFVSYRGRFFTGIVADSRFIRRYIYRRPRGASVRALRRRVFPNDQLNALHYGLLVFLGCLLVYLFLGALAPDSQQDSQWYHLSVARAWLYHNSLSSWAEIFPSNYSSLGCALYAFLLVLSPDTTNCTMTQWLHGLLGIGLSGAFAYEWYGRRACVWSMFLTSVALTTTCWVVPMHTGSDLMVMMFMTAGLLLTVDEFYGRPAVDGLRAQPASHGDAVPADPFGIDRLALIGLCLGFALATKITTLGWAMPAWFLLTAFALVRRTPPPLPWRHVIFMCGWIGMPCIVWLLRNTFLACGNPIYPIGRGFIPLNPGWEMLATRCTHLNNIYPLTLSGAMELFCDLPDKCTFFFINTSPQVVFSFVLAVSLLVFCRRPVAVALGLIGVLQWGVLSWLRGEDELVRQFGQTMSVVFVGGGLLMTRVEDSRFFNRRLRLFLLVLVALYFGGNSVKRQVQWGMMPPNNWKWRPVLSSADSLDYLRGCQYAGRRIDLFSELNAVLLNDAVVLVANGNFPFYLERKYYWCDDDLSYVTLLEARGKGDAAGVRSYLKDKGITHVVAAPGSLSGAWLDNLTTMVEVRAGAWKVN